MKTFIAAAMLIFAAVASAQSVSSSSGAVAVSSGNGSASAYSNSTATNNFKGVTVNSLSSGNAFGGAYGKATNQTGTVVKVAPVVVPTFTSKTTTKK